MKPTYTIAIVGDRRGKMMEFSLTRLELMAAAGVLIAVAVVTSWLALSAVPTLQERRSELGDPALTAEHEASLARAVGDVVASAHTVEDTLSVVSAALGSPVPDARRLFHETPDDALTLVEPAGPGDRLENISALLRDGAGTLEAAVQLDALLEDRLFKHIPNAWPLAGNLGRVSFEFGPAIHPITKSWYLHKGVDIAASPGVAVLAMADGTVTEVVRDLDNYGLQVVVSYAHGFRTRVAHLSRTDVAVGDTVEKGQRIGAVGASGLTTGPTLHLELFLGEEVLDPIAFLAMSNEFLQGRRPKT